MSFDLVYNICLKTLLILRKNQREYYNKCEQVVMKNTPYSCQNLMKLKFSKQIFENSFNMKFHESP
jgi:hypothetical protein